MKKNGFLVFIGLSILLSYSQFSLDKDSVEDTILSIIKQQEAAWNAHNINRFMSDYWESEELTFQSGKQRYYGWTSMLNRYKKNYPGEKMGNLSFSGLKTRVLSRDSAYVIGHWEVKQGETISKGVFTIIFKKFPSGWKIIHDHSS
jgi:beta-aspartyl-peptidase (threonine type)